MASIIDFFFKLGDKVSRGDPARQADFMYYMTWILFLAFFGMFGANVYRLIVFPFNADFIIWGVIGFAISSLQFFNLKQMHEMKKIRKGQKKDFVKEETIESVDEMLEGFKTKSKEDKKC